MKCFLSFTPSILLNTYLLHFLLPSTICQPFKKKFTMHTKRQKAQFDESEQASGPDPGMSGNLGLSDCWFESTMIYVVRALMEQVDTMKEHMGM